MSKFLRHKIFFFALYINDSKVSEGFLKTGQVVHEMIKILDDDSLYKFLISHCEDVSSSFVKTSLSVKGQNSFLIKYLQLRPTTTVLNVCDFYFGSTSHLSQVRLNSDFSTPSLTIDSGRSLCSFVGSKSFCLIFFCDVPTIYFLLLAFQILLLVFD